MLKRTIMRYSSFQQDRAPEKAIQVRLLLESDITFLPQKISNIIARSKADCGISLVAYEPNTECPTFYGVLLCKERCLEGEHLNGVGIELIEYSSSKECNPHIFMKLLRKVITNTMNKDNSPRYNYVYAIITDSSGRNRLSQWYGFNFLKDNPQFLFQTRKEILQIFEQSENA